MDSGRSIRSPPGQTMPTLSRILTILRQHRGTLRERFKIGEVGVFGSVVRGDTHSGSDVDILVEFTEPVSLLGLVSIENYLSDILGIKADVVPREDIRIELKDRIEREVVFA